MFKFHAIIFLVLLVSCASGRKSLKFTQSLGQGYYSNCWNEFKEAGCVIYKKTGKTLEDFEKVAYIKKIKNLLVRLDENGNRIFLTEQQRNSKSLSKVELFDNDGKLIEDPRISSYKSDRVMFSDLHMTYAFSQNCAPKSLRNSNNYAHKVSEGQIEKCQVDVYSDKEKMRSIKHSMGVWGSKGSLMSIFYKDGPNIFKYSYNRTGSLVEDPDNRALNLDGHNNRYTLKINNKTLEVEILGPSSKLNKGVFDRSQISSECKFYALHKHQVSGLDKVILSCPKQNSAAIMDINGKILTLNEYTRIEPYHIYYDNSHLNTQSSQKKPHLARAFVLGKQKNGKLALIGITQKEVNEFPDFGSVDEIAVLAKKIQFANPIMITAISNGKPYKKFSGLSEFVFKGQNFTIATDRYKLLPEGKWKKSDFIDYGNFMVTYRAEGSCIIYNDGHIAPMDSDNRAIAIKPFVPSFSPRKGEIIHTYYVNIYEGENNKKTYALAHQDGRPITDNNYRSAKLSGSTVSTQLVLEKYDGSYDAFLSYKNNRNLFLGNFKNLKEAQKVASKVVDNDRDKEFLAKQKAQKRGFYESMLVAKNNFGNSQLERYAEQCAKEVGGELCEKFTSEVNTRKAAEPKAYNPGSYTSRNIDFGYSASDQFRIGNQHSIKRMNANSKRLRGR